MARNPELSVGEKYHEWEIVEIIPNKGYLCKCSCGTERIQPKFRLLNGSSLSCGCLNKKLKFERRFETANIARFHGYKSGAKKRGLEFALSYEDFARITSNPCAYCGFSELREDGLAYKPSGIDRIDNSKGYRLDNSVPCCSKCNFAKHTMDYYEYMDFIKSVYDHSIGGKR